MNTRSFFLPPLNSRWRFAADWAPPQRFLDYPDNAATIHAETAANYVLWQRATGLRTSHFDAHGPGGWLEQSKNWAAAKRRERGTPEFLRGTVLQIERYHVSRSGEDQITVKVLAAPDLRLSPKKHGGKMVGTARLYMRLEDFNTLPEMEDVTDVVFD
jgi:hypothetical protein